MSFRKRNLVISQKGDLKRAPAKQVLPGVRTSPNTGRPTISTGTESLDRLLGLGAGFALGTSLSIEEEGTTDFARSLLSCYAAEGVVQGHAVLVVGPEGSLTLPGVIEPGEKKKSLGATGAENERMKIAWRYEKLGAFGDRERAPVIPNSPKAGDTSASDAAGEAVIPFCHSFDLTKRLAIPSSSQPPSYFGPSMLRSSSPFTAILEKLRLHLSSNISMPTRLLIPSLLSPIFHPPTSSQPHYLISFLHQLRALLRTYTHLTVMISWPLALYPPTHPLTRWSRHLLDGVITLRPFPHSFSIDAADLGSDAGGRTEEKMQGLLKVSRLPVLSEKGIAVGVGEDMAFAVGRKRFLIRPFHLPPLDAESEERGTESTAKSGEGLEF